MKILFAFYVMTCANAGSECYADNLFTFESRTTCEKFEKHFVSNYRAKQGDIITRTNCEKVWTK